MGIISSSVYVRVCRQVEDKHKVMGAAGALPVSAVKNDAAPVKAEQETVASPPQPVGEYFTIGSYLINCNLQISTLK